MIEELQEKVNRLEKEINELKETVRILSQTHSFDIAHVIEQIDKINN